MMWIVGAYIILTLGEVLLYGTMLDLSYAYAPARMKGFITACFLVTNALGNLINSQYAKNFNTTMTPQTFFAIDAGDLCGGGHSVLLRRPAVQSGRHASGTIRSSFDSSLFC